MSEDLFLAAVKQITAGELNLGDAIGKAQALNSAGRPDLAAQLYQIWSNFNLEHPLLYVARFNGAVLLTQLGELKASAEALKAAVGQNPDFMPAHINLGGVLERMGEREAALACRR